MNKCCDNCKHLDVTFEQFCRFEIFTNVEQKEWNTSKDYCSKWEEKEDKMITLKGELGWYTGEYMYKCQDCGKMCTGVKRGWRCESCATRLAETVTKYFKQRIEESLSMIRFDTLEDNHRTIEVFDWILDQ